MFQYRTHRLSWWGVRYWDVNRGVTKCMKPFNNNNKTHCCVSIIMTNIDIFRLAIQRENIIEFPWWQWLRECYEVLLYTYIACRVITGCWTPDLNTDVPFRSHAAGMSACIVWRSISVHHLWLSVVCTMQNSSTFCRKKEISHVGMRCVYNWQPFAVIEQHGTGRSLTEDECKMLQDKA